MVKTWPKGGEEFFRVNFADWKSRYYKSNNFFLHFDAINHLLCIWFLFKYVQTCIEK